MELIINDFSIEGQFEDLEQFEEYYVTILRKIFMEMDELQITLYKKSTTYSQSITPKCTLLEYIKRANNPAATSIKEHIIELAMQKPYWDEEGEIKTDIDNSIYLCPYDEEAPNCFSEAVERNAHILSIHHEKYSEDNLVCEKNGQSYLIDNIKQKDDLLWLYLKEDLSNLKHVIEHMDFEKQVEFFSEDKKCYAMDSIMESSLSEEDVVKIIEKIPRLINDKMSGKKSHFYEDLQDGITEYRLTISDDREFRLFFLWNEKVVFLNGGIKKQQKANKLDVQRARKLAKRYKDK